MLPVDCDVVRHDSHVSYTSGQWVRLLQQLHDIPESTSFEAEDMHALLMWSLFIASIAAAKTSEQQYFETKLLALLTTKAITSWTAVHAELAPFLWSKSACNEGGQAVWNSLAKGLSS